MQEDLGYEADATTTRFWWVFLVTGILWILFALTVFQGDYTTVNAISILFGIVVVAAGLNEFVTAGFTSGGWKAVHVVLGVLFVVIGIVAFTKPDGTFTALAQVFSYYLAFMGIFDIVVAFMNRGDAGWWFRLVAGVLMLALAVWAAGDFDQKVILLVVWVGVSSMTRGVMQIVLAFTLKGGAGGGNRLAAA